MKYALQIYGQLRTFDKALPSFLHFIDYYNLDYDVFLFIDRNNEYSKSYYISNDNYTKSNYSEYNLEFLKKLLIEDRIKILDYVDNMSPDEKAFEINQKNKMLELWNKFNSKYDSIVMNDFTTSLTFRKYLLNNMRKKYEVLNNIKYDYIIQGRFDFGTTYNSVYKITESTTPILFSDCIAIGNTSFINTMAEYGLYYPITPKVLFDNECNLLVDKYEKYKDWKGDKFIDKHWIFMPELNQRLYLLENSYTFIEAWWETPCNYGFKIIR